MGSIDPLPTFDLDAVRRSFDDQTRPHEQQWQRGSTTLRAWKHADDLARYREAYARSRPEVLIETGTRWGGSAWWFREHLQIPEVISIDINPVVPEVLTRIPGLTFLRASSTEPHLVGSIAEQVSGRRVMVSLDSDHHYRHVRDEIELWAPLVTPGCYLVVEDGCFDLLPPDEARRGGHRIPEVGGPLDAVNDSELPDSPQWERAVDVEGMTPITHNPGGWWRRRG